MGISVGSVTFEDPVILAPMSGVSDLPFRRLVKRLGAGLVVSEMIASEAMIRAPRSALSFAASAMTRGSHPASCTAIGCSSAQLLAIVVD